METHRPGGRAVQIDTELRRYVAEHPCAGDTVDGVGRWWLSPGLARIALPDEIEQGLELLVREGLLERRTLPDGSFLYRVRGRGEVT